MNAGHSSYKRWSKPAPADLRYACPYKTPKQAPALQKKNAPTVSDRGASIVLNCACTACYGSFQREILRLALLAQDDGPNRIVSRCRTAPNVGSGRPG